MSLVLLIYSEYAFKEYLLPSIDNSDYSLVLSKDIFCIANNLEVKLEVMDQKWHFARSNDYTLTKSDKDYFEEKLVGQDVIKMTLPTGQNLTIVVRKVEKYFSVYEKFDLMGHEKLTIGKNKENMICFDDLGVISRKHASINRSGQYYIIEDYSANGTFVNHVRIQGKYQLAFGDCVDIFGLRLVFLGNQLAVNTRHPHVVINRELLKQTPIEEVGEEEEDEQEHAKNPIFHRSPRYMNKIDTEPIEIEAPPQPKQAQKQPLLMLIGPSMTMALPMLLGCGLSIYGSRKNGSSAMMYTGLVTAISSALIATIWSLINLNYSKKKNREEELHRFEAYGEYLIKQTETIKASYEKNTQILKERYIEPSTCCHYDENNAKLWERNLTHQDFLTHRIGMGDIPFQVPIIIPKERFTLINDNLAQKPKFIKENYEQLKEVPVCIDLMKNPLIGIIGGEEKRGAMSVVHSLAAQIAASNCYTDVKMIFVYNGSSNRAQENWGFAKWLPHVWSEDKKSRFVATNKSEASDIFYELTKILRFRQEEYEAMHRKGAVYKPYYILFIESLDFLEGELIAKYIFDKDKQLGMSTILMVENYEQLPNACTHLIQNDEEYQGMYEITGEQEERIAVKFDQIAPVELEKLARNLANIEVSEIEVGGEIPNALTFFDMYGISSLEEMEVLERWKKNRTYENMKALIGHKSGGRPCYLDVHEKYHGPHGLIAGTTGSGKSETLQTYILSLAMNYSPDDIGFFIIDYKGGGMANLFSNLPHLIGQISNLSGNQTRRAMVSIKSENKRRQRIFNEYGVNNINLYTRLYKNNEAKLPIPHLFIIIDEFAELKREEPDFMRELISVAQVGRSLGVHLILATQKPSGTVDDNIWSNSKFRLCLRVQDKQDSNDMLHKPDAAYITQAGRCYMQVGNDEIYELFQSGYSGAAYDEEAGSSKTDIAKMISNTGKAALVGSKVKKKQKEEKKVRWITSLIQMVDEGAKDMACSVEEAIESHLDKLISQMYLKVKKQKIDYPVSEYNTHRLTDLIRLYKNLKTEHKIKEQIAEEIINVADFKGIRLPEMKEPTQLDVTIDYLKQIAVENGYTRSVQLWLPVLPTRLYMNDLKNYEEKSLNDEAWQNAPNKWSLKVQVGLCDDPVNQAQMPLEIDLAETGHLAVCGLVASGKSTFLQSFIYQLVMHYSADYINIYAIDYSSKMMSAFDKAPQVGGIVFENEEDRLEKLFNMLMQCLEERKILLRGGSYSQYVQSKGMTIPCIILVIDNVADFRNKTNNKYDDLILQLTRDGVGYGIFLIFAASGFGAMEIPTRVSDNIRKVISLEMNDKFQYADVMRNMHLQVLPEVGVKGRGLAEVGEDILEFQTALALEAEDDYKRLEAIGVICQKLREEWTGRKAKAIPEIPEKPVWKEFAELDDVQKMNERSYRLAMGYDASNASIYGLDLERTYSYIVSGKARTGKSNLMKVMMLSALSKGGKIVLIDYQKEYEAFKASLGEVTYVTNDQELYNYCLTLKDLFIPRNKKKNAWIKEGFEDEEIFEKMQDEEKVFLFVADLTEFIKHVYSPSEGIQAMSGFLENITDKGYLHNVFWISAYNQDTYLEVVGKKVYENMIRAKCGIHLGGNVSAQRIFEFSYIPYMQQNKSQKAGIGMLPSTDEEETTQKVVIPMVKL